MHFGGGGGGGSKTTKRPQWRELPPPQGRVGDEEREQPAMQHRLSLLLRRRALLVAQRQQAVEGALARLEDGGLDGEPDLLDQGLDLVRKRDARRMPVARRLECLVEVEELGGNVRGDRVRKDDDLGRPAPRVRVVEEGRRFGLLLGLRRAIAAPSPRAAPSAPLAAHAARRGRGAPRRSARRRGGCTGSERRRCATGHSGSCTTRNRSEARARRTRPCHPPRSSGSRAPRSASRRRARRTRPCHSARTCRSQAPCSASRRCRARSTSSPRSDAVRTSSSQTGHTRYAFEQASDRCR